MQRSNPSSAAGFWLENQPLSSGFLGNLEAPLQKTWQKLQLRSDIMQQIWCRQLRFESIFLPFRWWCEDHVKAVRGNRVSHQWTSHLCLSETGSAPSQADHTRHSSGDHHLSGKNNTESERKVWKEMHEEINPPFHPAVKKSCFIARCVFC